MTPEELREKVARAILTSRQRCDLAEYGRWCNEHSQPTVLCDADAAIRVVCEAMADELGTLYHRHWSQFEHAVQQDDFRAQVKGFAAADALAEATDRIRDLIPKENNDD